jgi:transcription initiation factor TFIID subunit TAF12
VRVVAPPAALKLRLISIVESPSTPLTPNPSPRREKGDRNTENTNVYGSSNGGGLNLEGRRAGVVLRQILRVLQVRRLRDLLDAVLRRVLRGLALSSA